MTALSITLPPPLNELVRQLAIRRGTSTDSLIASIISRELGSATHRLYRAVLNGVMTLLKTLAAVAAATALATIAFAKAARGAPHKRKRSDIRDQIG